MTLDPGKKRYDPETSLHNHLICVSCKKIVDVHGEYKLDLPENAKQEYSIIGSHVEFYGLCPECNNMKISPAKEASSCA